MGLPFVVDGVCITGSQGELAEFGVCVVPDTSNLAAWAWRVGETVRGAFLIGGTEVGV